MGTIVVLAALISGLAFPSIALPFVLAFAVLQIGLGISQTWLKRRAAVVPSGRGEDCPAPVFSVHVPSHNEPSEVLLATLQALEAQRDAPPHEVIVIDNNTSDRTLWEPVRDWCATRPGFRFLHRLGVAGAKAGALNIALDETRSDATHIVVVDADYVVAPDFLSRASKMLASWNADFIQFPQAYVGERHAEGTSLELEDYFYRYAVRANGADAMLLTGTLSVISRPALHAVGGWRSDTVTEDAELGLRLCRHGYRGRFIDQCVGRGFLPFDMASLHAQRFRWTAGNVRTLVLGLEGLTLRQGLVVLLQLTAWANFGLIFAVALIASTLHRYLFGSSPDGALLAGVANAGLLACYATSLGPLLTTCLARGRNAAATLEALTNRIALIPTSAFATFQALSGGESRFVVTSKTLAGGKDGVPLPATLWALGGVALFLFVPSPATALGAILMAAPAFACMLVDRRLRDYRTALARHGAPA